MTAALYIEIHFEWKLSYESVLSTNEYLFNQKFIFVILRQSLN